jgi:hypothetical protein
MYEGIDNPKTKDMWEPGMDLQRRRDFCFFLMIMMDYVWSGNELFDAMGLRALTVIRVLYFLLLL